LHTVQLRFWGQTVYVLIYPRAPSLHQW